MTLVESVRKKAAFLRHIIRSLRLEGVKVIDARTNATDLAKEYHRYARETGAASKIIKIK
jgi:16S rRNA G527 N7-methylase RsmG